MIGLLTPQTRRPTKAQANPNQGPSVGAFRPHPTIADSEPMGSASGGDPKLHGQCGRYSTAKSLLTVFGHDDQLPVHGLVRMVGLVRMAGHHDHER